MKSSSKRFHKWIIGFILIISAFGYLNAEELIDVRLQLKWEHQFQFAGYYAAIEKGFYAEKGFRVQLLPPISSESPFDAVVNGKAEFGTSTTDILVARSNGEKVVVLATIFQHSPHIFLTSKGSGIMYAHNLVGKRISIEPGADELLAFLVAEGVRLEDCIIDEGKFDYRKLIDNRVDAITAYSTDEPFSFKQLDFEVNYLYPSSAGIDFYGDLLFTGEGLVKSNPKMVEDFRSASLKGWEYAMSNHEEIADLILSKYSQRHSREHLLFEAQQMQKLLLPNIVPIGYSNPGRWNAILNSYKKLDRVKQELTIAGLVYEPESDQKHDIHWRSILVLSFILVIVLSLLYFFLRLNIKLRKEIVEREKFEKDLYKQEALYRSILKASPDIVTITDLHGIILEVSQKAVESVGLEDEMDIIGKNMADFVHPEDVERALGNSQQLLEGIHFEPEEYCLVNAQGDKLETEINADVIKDDSGTPTGVVMIIRDIHERKAHEEELRKKTEELIKTYAEKDKFFSIIAHDLRSPFNTFFGFTELLSTEIEQMDTDEIRSLAESLNTSATTLYRLLENLLQWARMERGLTIPKPVDFEIKTIVDVCVKVYAESLKNKNLTLNIDLPSDIKVNADYQMTDTVIRNLLSNAIKYTVKGGLIGIKARRSEDNYAVISFTDNGIGMSKENYDNLFRIDIADSRLGTEGETSSGLGLIICKEFIEANGGTLTVSSIEGKGSEFTFTLNSQN